MKLSMRDSLALYPLLYMLHATAHGLVTFFFFLSDFTTRSNPGGVFSSMDSAFNLNFLDLPRVTDGRDFRPYPDALRALIFHGAERLLRRGRDDQGPIFFFLNH